jgi:16S rRNA (guanine1207-N2)-methyltransferase
MTRWARDPEGAADALILHSLDEIAIVGRVLAVNQGGALPAAVRRHGADCTVWNRRLAVPAAVPAAPWPPQGPFDLAFVRLPKAREEQAMTVHATLSVLRPGGRLVLYGGNDEGIRSADAVLGEIASDVTTLAARGHGRVLAALRGDRAGQARATLEAWRAVARMEIAGSARDWVSYPGCFAAGRIDEGTALLLGALPPLVPPLTSGAHVLDYGCGTGIIAATLLAIEPALKVDTMDNDSVALAAARENVPAARRILGTRLVDAGRRDYAAILSNPPLHQGIAEDRIQLERLIADAPARLAPGGILQLVVQRRIAIERELARHFATVATVAETARYSVLRAGMRAP